MDTETNLLATNTTHLTKNGIRSYDSIGCLPENELFVDSKPSKFPQYKAVISVTLSALASGIISGWTSPISPIIEHGHYNNIPVNVDQMGWIGSLTNLGAVVACIPTGFICDRIGRKTTLILLLVPFTLGWILTMTANNLAILYSGRFISGIAFGSCSVAVPMYISEIAHKTVRGNLGSYFQLMLSLGVLYAYVFGAFMTPFYYTLICAVEILLFAFTFVFQPESPLFYLKTGQDNQAQRTLQGLRGKDFDTTEEMDELQQSLKKSSNYLGLIAAFKGKAFRKALIISLCLMFFQQFSGINAIIFYTSDIFINAGVKLDPRYCSIIIGVCQVVANVGATLVIDRLGQRILLIASALVMSLSLILLGTLFILKEHGLIPEETLKVLSFLPIVLLVVYMLAFSVGFGPIPWMLNGELFSPEVKGTACSISVAFNRFLAFVITKYYLQVDKKLGDDNMYYLFGGILVVAAAFVWWMVPETKGKSIAEIQDELQQ